MSLVLVSRNVEGSAEPSEDTTWSIDVLPVPQPSDVEPQETQEIATATVESRSFGKRHLLAGPSTRWRSTLASPKHIERLSVHLSFSLVHVDNRPLLTQQHNEIRISPSWQ